MRTILLILGITLSTMAEVPEHLLNAIALVESNACDSAVGDGGRAVGRYQLHRIYVDEVNRINALKGSVERYTPEDRLDAEKSRLMVKAYLDYWSDRYELETGLTATDEVFAKIHNGHAFWRRDNESYLKRLEGYWEKVRELL